MLDIGIIANFKYQYRRLQYKHVAIQHARMVNKANSNNDGDNSDDEERNQPKEKPKPFFWIDQLQAMR